MNLHISATAYDRSFVRMMEKVVAAVASVSNPSGKSIRRIAIELGETDPLTWLAEHTAAHRVYWRGRDQLQECAGIGVALVLYAEDKVSLSEQIRALDRIRCRADSGCRFYGGIRFDSTRPPAQRSQEWSTFGAGWFVLPRLELIREGAAVHLVCNLTADECLQAGREAVIRELQTFAHTPQQTATGNPAITYRDDLPTREGWLQRVNQALELFSAGVSEKIVLARRSSLAFSGRLDPWSLLVRLRETSVDSYLFGFQPGGKQVFIGASPEQLYARTGRRIESEAVAGTRKRATSDDEDKQLAEALLHSEKERREHRLVVSSVKEALGRVCRYLEAEGTLGVRKLSRVQHLASRFAGELADNVTDWDLLNVLHPTPAVGGSPTYSAQNEIARLEPFDRGWYSGPVGWLGSDCSEFAVAIRSGLIDADRLELYSGAGIVRGSQPEQEWNEIENKISTLLRAVDRS